VNFNQTTLLLAITVGLSQSDFMITAGSYPPITIDFGKDEPGMTLQYRDVKNGYIVWRDVVKDGQVVKSSFDIDALQFGVYRFIAP